MKKTLTLFAILAILPITYKIIVNQNSNENYKVGQPIDSLNNVIVYYNGEVDNVIGRNVKNGYNLGLKYQCVEFVKRYYYEFYNHKMPDSYGHAKSFFNLTISDGEYNEQRNLIQFSNPSKSKPKKNDLIVMKGTIFNIYGHVAIVSKVLENKIEIIQQNPGPFSPSREIFEFIKTTEGKWKIENNKILGWLRK